MTNDRSLVEGFATGRDENRGKLSTTGKEIDGAKGRDDGVQGETLHFKSGLTARKRSGEKEKSAHKEKPFLGIQKKI